VGPPHHNHPIEAAALAAADTLGYIIFIFITKHISNIMMSLITASLLSTTIILSSYPLLAAAVVSPFTFYDLIGDALFLNENPEASGLALAPDSTHLAGVTDSGRIFFINLDDYTSGHCSVDVTAGNNVITPNKFEGIAIDTTEWSSTGDRYAYLIHEGSSTAEPYLHKIKYTYDSSNGSCSVTLVKSTTYWCSTMF